MLQVDTSDGEAGDVFEMRLLGGSVELQFILNRSLVDGEFSAVFFPADGPLADFPCLFKPSFFADFLREPRKPVCNEDYTMLSPGSFCQYPAIISGNALACELLAKSLPARQADPTTPTKTGSRLRGCFPPSCKWLPRYRNSRRSKCIPRQLPPVQLAKSS